MITNISIFIFYCAIWLALTCSFSLPNIIKAALISAAVLFFTRSLFKKEGAVFKGPQRYLWFLYYIPLFIWECFKANLDGAWRVIQPDLPMRPGIVKVKTRLKSETGLTFLANSITLKPGTMTVDIDQENGFIYVHWVDVESQDIEKATRQIVDKFEKVLLRIFG